MPDKTNVSIKCDAKEVYKKLSKPDALNALKAAVVGPVNANSNFSTTAKSKVSIFLKVTLSLTADDADKPTKLTLKVSIDAMLMGATAAAFKATTNANMDGLNQKNLDKSAAELIDAVVPDFMKAKVIPQMVKMLP